MIDDAQAQSSADMMNRFLAPPQAARAWVYWFWINGNLSLEGVTADLEAMKRIGVEGAVIYHVLGTPAGPVGFLTAQWRKILQHAISEASRLDMVIGINNCDGWGAGGPWVKPEHAMQKVVWTQKHVQGGKTYSDALAQPIVNLGYYRDIAVIALRAPAGDEVPQDLTPHITVKPELPFTVTHEYADRVTARGATVTLMINQDNPSVPAVWDLQVSDDGENFRYVYRFDRGWRFTEWSLQRDRKSVV